MELFLNLCWLSLLLPAYLLWRRRSSTAHRNGRVIRPATRTLVSVYALGCAFILLFPVISASDDLHAMRAEMEESSPGKRSVCQAGGERSSVWHNRWENLPGIVATAALLGSTSEGRLETSAIVVS